MHRRQLGQAALATSLLGALPMTAALAQTQPPAPADIRGVTTRFDSPAALAAWRQHNVPGFSPKWQPPAVQDGALVLRPLSSGWFEDMQAGHLYREIEGNFVVTTRIRVEGTRAPLPQTLFSLAGIFIRAPREGLTAANWQPGRENWLFFSLGTAFPAGTPQFEVKTTFNSLSTLRISDAAAAYPNGRPAWVELRVARQGELFSLLHRVEGQREFTLLDQFIRPDLPAMLNVGLTAYSDWNTETNHYPDFVAHNTRPAPNNADLVARVERIEFRRPTVDRFPVASFDVRSSFMPEVSQRRIDDLIRN
jgi:hypothetical protein